MIEKEKWKIIKNHTNYLVSNWGRFYSLKSEKFLKSYIHKSRANLYLRINSMVIFVFDEIASQ